MNLSTANTPPRLTPRTAWTALGLIGLATLAYVLIGRPLIARAYHGESFELLNRAFAARDTHTLAHYTAFADRLFAIALCFALAAGFSILHALRRAPYAAALAIVLAGGALVRLAVAVRDPLTLQTWPLNDDSHYYFNIAWNFAHGAGLKHDSFHLTNGFQPLFLFLITPLFRLAASKTAAVTLVLLFQTLVGTLAGWALARLVRTVSNSVIALAAAGLWAFSMTFVEVDLNGLETGLSFLLLALTCTAYIRGPMREPDPAPRAWIRLGVWIGLCFLARIDNGMLGVAIAADVAVRRLRAFGPAKLLRTLLRLALPALAVASPWFLFNLAAFGHPLPTGGRAVRFLSQAYGYRFLGRPGLYAPHLDHIPGDYFIDTLRGAFEAIAYMCASTFPLLPAGAIVVLGLLLGARALARGAGRVAFVFLFLLLLLASYVLYIFGQWFFYRYLSPFLIGYVLAAAIGARAMLEPFEIERRRAARAAVATAFLLAVFGRLALNTPGLAADALYRRDDLYRAAEWLNANTPPDAVIGGFQTGILGYYLERPFHGLDGKINDDALEALRAKRIDIYIREHGIDYLADWPWILHDLCERRSEDPDFLSRQERVHLNEGVAVYRIGEGR